MAYTYDDFTLAANKAGLTFDQADMDIAKVNPEYGMSLVKLTQDVNSAGTAEQKLLAQEAVNQLRKSYGGTTTSAGGSFTYGKQNEYQQLLDKVANRDPFSYDQTADPMYSSYKKNYLREADRATQDALAQASTMSGGRPSSYAMNAAMQAGNYYRGQLNDMMPTLQQNAFQRYLSEYSNDLSALNAMSADRDFDFNAYLQQYSEQQQAWNNALTLLQAGYDTPEIRKILGLPEKDVSASGTEKKSGGGTAPKSGDSTGGTTSVDLNSVLNLGYGPISANTLDNLVNAGSVNYNPQTGTVSKNDKKSELNPVFGAVFR